MDIFLALAIAFLVTIISTPFAIWAARRFDLVDDPLRRPHPAHVQNRVIPRAGGLAIFCGIFLTSLIFLPLDKHLVGIFAGITLLLILGLLDDKLVKFSPYLRLGLLFLAASLPVASGIGITFINNPLSHLPFLPTDLTTPLIFLNQITVPLDFFGPHKIILLADLFALFWIVTLTQIINWSKGVDGQMSGITLVTALTLGLLALKFYNLGDPSQLNVAKLSFIVAGTSLGFLIFNWYPSKIMAGFSGSTISAFLLATLSILSSAKVATALLVLAIPTIDFTYTFWRRVLQGKSPVWGDQGHFHHRLLDLGWSHQKISLFYISGSAILGAVALLIDTESKFFVILLVAAIFCGFILWLNSFGDFSKKPGPGNG
ncbi:MAG: MraY family glycosyltransferase [bacterium]|nr:MraY family glycosyltransferase [bacterium]